MGMLQIALWLISVKPSHCSPVGKSCHMSWDCLVRQDTGSTAQLLTGTVQNVMGQNNFVPALKSKSYERLTPWEGELVFWPVST